MIKVVLDTSVFVSALLTRNPNTAPSRILKHWQEGVFALVISPQMQEELIIVLTRKRIKSEL